MHDQHRDHQDAYELLTQADDLSELADDDLEKLAWSAGLSGRDSESLRLLERLYRLRIDVEAPRRAAFVAFWIGFRMTAVEPGCSTAWLERARRLVDREPQGCAERGYLLLLDAMRAIARGELEAGLSHANAIIEIGERFADPNVTAFGRVFRGRALV